VSDLYHDSRHLLHSLFTVSLFFLISDGNVKQLSSLKNNPHVTMAFWLFGGTKPKKSSKKSKKGTKNNKTIASSKPKITDPPNVFRPARPQIEPPPYPGNVRPNTAALRPALPYNQHHASQSQPHFQPAGYLPAPPGFSTQPVVINNHYHLGSQQSHPNLSAFTPPHHLATTNSHQTLSSSLNRFKGSMVNLAKESLPPQLYDDGLSAWHGCAQIAQSTNALYDRFNDIMTLIDHEKVQGNESKLFNCAVTDQEQKTDQVDKGMGKTKNKEKSSCNVAASVVSGNYFSKVEQYANSKLPLTLPPLSLYVYPPSFISLLTETDTCLHGLSFVSPLSTPSASTKDLAAPNETPMFHPTGSLAPGRPASSPFPWTT
jgi:hypothetical protein